MASRERIANRKHAPHHLGRVLVLGLGKSGRAAVAYLLPLLDGRVEAPVSYTHLTLPTNREV